MKKLILPILIAIPLLSGCGVNPQKAKSALEAQGLTDIEIGSYSFFGCSDNDSFRSKFRAKGANGDIVYGVVCSGFLKGITVRYD